MATLEQLLQSLGQVQEHKPAGSDFMAGPARPATDLGAIIPGSAKNGPGAAPGGQNPLGSIMGMLGGGGGGAGGAGAAAGAAGAAEGAGAAGAGGAAAGGSASLMELLPMLAMLA